VPRSLFLWSRAYQIPVLQKWHKEDGAAANSATFDVAIPNMASPGRSPAPIASSSSKTHHERESGAYAVLFDFLLNFAKFCSWHRRFAAPTFASCWPTPVRAVPLI